MLSRNTCLLFIHYSAELVYISIQSALMLLLGCQYHGNIKLFFSAWLGWFIGYLIKVPVSHVVGAPFTINKPAGRGYAGALFNKNLRNKTEFFNKLFTTVNKKL
jgi:hypothetical protein